jgi:hypothetical protein
MNAVDALREMRAWAQDAEWKDVRHYSDLDDETLWPDTDILDGIEAHYLATTGAENGVAGFLNDLYFAEAGTPASTANGDDS